MITRALPYTLSVACLPLLTYCAEPVIVDPNRDGGHGKNDSGAPTIQWQATPAPNAALYSQFGLAMNQHFRERKIDPYFLRDGQNQYVFFAGSPATGGQWSIGLFSQTGVPPDNNSMATQILSWRTGSWDAVDLTGPMVRYNPAASNPSDHWMLYYSATGDPNRPKYVSQIGLATSADGMTWIRGTAPLLAAPTFTGTDPSATPTTKQPDAYGLSDPWVVPLDGNNAAMYYTGLDCDSGPCRFQILRAFSSDGGHSFSPGNVVLTGRTGVADEAGGVAAPSLVMNNGMYLLAYTAVNTSPQKDPASIRDALTMGTIGLAASTDGVKFTNAAVGGNALIGRVTGTYRADGCSAPSLYLDGSQLRAWYSAYVASGALYSIAQADLFQTVNM